MAEWDEHTRLQNEKEVLGFFVSGHPMDKYREKLRNMKVVDTVTACEMKPEPQAFRRRGEEPQNEISIAGVITGLKVGKSKRSGELYAQASLEDTVGKIELIAFSANYEKLKEKLKIDVPVVVRGVLRGEEDSAPKLSVSNIQALEDVKIKLPDSLRIKVPLHNPDAALLEKTPRRLPRRTRQRQSAARPRRARRVLRRPRAPQHHGRRRPPLHRPHRRARRPWRSSRHGLAIKTLRPFCIVNLQGPIQHNHLQEGAT